MRERTARLHQIDHTGNKAVKIADLSVLEEKIASLEASGKAPKKLLRQLEQQRRKIIFGQ